MAAAFIAIHSLLFLFCRHHHVSTLYLCTCSKGVSTYSYFCKWASASLFPPTSLSRSRNEMEGAESRRRRKRARRLWKFENNPNQQPSPSPFLLCGFHPLCRMRKPASPTKKPPVLFLPPSVFRSSHIIYRYMPEPGPTLLLQTPSK